MISIQTYVPILRGFRYDGEGQDYADALVRLAAAGFTELSCQVNGDQSALDVTYQDPDSDSHGDTVTVTVQLGGLIIFEPGSYASAARAHVYAPGEEPIYYRQL